MILPLDKNADSTNINRRKAIIQNVILLVSNFLMLNASFFLSDSTSHPILCVDHKAQRFNKMERKAFKVTPSSPTEIEEGRQEPSRVFRLGM